MKIIGFNLTKILIEKKNHFTKPPEIKTAMNISDIKEVSLDLFKEKESPLEVRFNYDINYEPSIANISFEGHIILLTDEKESKEILKKWKKKDLPEEFKLFIFNAILRKTNVKAIQLEDEMNLPIHFQMPSLQVKSKKDKK